MTLTTRNARILAACNYLAGMLKNAFNPCIPTKAAKVPDRPEWIHEIKHDGYRLIIQRDGTRVRLWTRNGHDWSGRFPLITEAALRNRNSSRAARRRRAIGFQRPALPPASVPPRPRGQGFKTPREHLPRRPVGSLDQGQEPAASGVQPGTGSVLVVYRQARNDRGRFA